MNIKNTVKKIRNLFPSALPVGVTEFEAWASDIVTTYNFPDNDSLRFTLASMILALGPTRAYRSKFYFYLSVRSSMAKQIASHMMYDLKEKQKAAAAAAAQVTAEATAPVESATSGQ